MAKAETTRKQRREYILNKVYKGEKINRKTLAFENGVSLVTATMDMRIFRAMYPGLIDYDTSSREWVIIGQLKDYGHLLRFDAGQDRFYEREE